MDLVSVCLHVERVFLRWNEFTIEECPGDLVVLNFTSLISMNSRWNPFQVVSIETLSTDVFTSARSKRQRTKEMLSVNMLRGLSRRGGAPVHGLSNRLSSSAAAAAVASSPSTAQTQTPHREPVFKTRRRQLLPFIESLALPPPTVEEAVNNILYNTPTDAATPVKRHTLNCLVANEPVRFFLCLCVWKAPDTYL